MDKIKLNYEDGSYIFVNPFIIEISVDQVKDKNLPRSLYKLPNKSNPLFYQEELEWYWVDNRNILHFIGYTTDEFIRENISRRINII
jgi:hypothetical protein